MRNNGNNRQFEIYFLNSTKPCKTSNIIFSSVITFKFQEISKLQHHVVTEKPPYHVQYKNEIKKARRVAPEKKASRKKKTKNNDWEQARVSKTVQSYAVNKIHQQCVSFLDYTDESRISRKKSTAAPFYFSMATIRTRTDGQIPRQIFTTRYSAMPELPDS